MPKRRTFLFLIAHCLLLAGCVEWISLNTTDPSLPVVQCVLQDTDHQKLALFWTNRNDDMGQPASITEAEVVLSVMENGEIKKVGAFQRGDDGTWRLAYKPIYGQHYLLSVTTGQIELSARTVMPYPIRCETVPNPILIAYPEKADKHLYPSRRIFSDGPSDSFPVLAWFTGKNGFADELYATHPQTESFNNCPDGILFSYDGLIESGSLPLSIIDKQFWIPFHKWMVLFTCSGNENNPYHFPVSPIFSSSYSLIDLRKTMENHPESGALEQRGEIWGPCFDIWPRNMREADTLHLMCPSPELQAYLKSVTGLFTPNRSDFTAMFSQVSPYTNIVGGKGIFGAVTQWKENYTDYDSRMSNYYQALHRDELEAQQQE